MSFGGMCANIKVLTFLVMLRWYKKLRFSRIIKQDYKDIYAYLNKVIYMS